MPKVNYITCNGNDHHAGCHAGDQDRTAHSNCHAEVLDAYGPGRFLEHGKHYSIQGSHGTQFLGKVK